MSYALVGLVLMLAGQAFAQGDVTAYVVLKEDGAKKITGKEASVTAVVWLNPIDSNVRAQPERFKLIQKDKAFHPHLLVVPLGSTVDFPNLDPFFHNVFSRFNGKRFDLGLYEAGSTKTVHFDHEGVSYIFCNIHPEMSAVVIALATPYRTVAQKNGEIAMRDIPAGAYEMHVWAEGVDSKQLNALTRRIRVGVTPLNIGTIELVRNESPEHKNKFGEDYQHQPDVVY